MSHGHHHVLPGVNNEICEWMHVHILGEIPTYIFHIAQPGSVAVLDQVVMGVVYLEMGGAYQHYLWSLTLEDSGWAIVLRQY